MASFSPPCVWIKYYLLLSLFPCEFIALSELFSALSYLRLSLQLAYSPPCPPHAAPWLAVGEPCRSSARRWRRDAYHAGHLLGDRPGNPTCCWASTSVPSSWFISGMRGVSCPGSWEGAQGHPWRWDSSAVSAVCSPYLRLLSQTLAKHQSFVGSLQPWWLQLSCGVWHPVLSSLKKKKWNYHYTGLLIFLMPLSHFNLHCLSL